MYNLHKQSNVITAKAKQAQNRQKHLLHNFDGMIRQEDRGEKLGFNEVQSAFKMFEFLESKKKYYASLSTRNPVYKQENQSPMPS